MREVLFSLFAAATLSACSSSNSLTEQAKVALNEHQAQWEQRTFTSYSYDLFQKQFAAETTDVHITVNGTTVVSVVDKNTGQPPTGDATWPTIDDLYAAAQQAINAKGTTLSVEFDTQYSYPTLVAISSQTRGGPYEAHASHLTPSP